MRHRTPANPRDPMRLVVLVWFAFVAITVAVTACVDESHELQVQALGGEASGVPKGPLHRPGQPCLVCHGEGGPASTQFVVAGTVFESQGKTAPANGAQVQIEDVTGSFYTATTNEVGNFYIAPDQWAPTMPLQVQVSQGKNLQTMGTRVGRAGSCADCHTSTSGPASAGPVYVVSAPTGGP
jgi:cytochrome c553